MDIRILLVVVMGDLADHVGIVAGVVLDEVHLELTLGQGIRIEMGDEMRHIIVELDHRLGRRPRRRSSGCFVCCSVVGVVLAIFVDIILGRSDREDSHILGYTGSRGSRRRAVKLTWTQRRGTLETMGSGTRYGSKYAPGQGSGVGGDSRGGSSSYL